MHWRFSIPVTQSQSLRRGGVQACLMILALFGAVPAGAQGPELRAGIARVDITPPVGHAMGGYSARKENAKETFDRLYATALVFESGDTSLAIVAADLRSFVSSRVAQLAREQFGVTRTIISSSHTHSGPLTWELRSPWYTEAEDKMVEAIGLAKRAMFPAQLSFASGPAHLGFNRRRVENGKVEMWWRNTEKRPSSPIDPEVSVLLIRDRQRNAKLVLVNYACHPSIFGPDNLAWSADYPGALRRHVEQMLSGARLVFVQGGAGDINPFHDKEPVANAGFAVDSMGRALATRVADLASRATPIDGGLQLAADAMRFGNRWRPTEAIDVGLLAGRIGGAVCFLALPGEPFVQHQIAFRDRSECRYAMLFGYSHTGEGVWPGYLPTIEAAVAGGYGADYNTTIEVGAGEMLIDRGIIQLFRLRGLLKDLPEGN